MDFLVLGPLELRHEGRPVAVRSGKLAELLAVLLLRRDEVVSTDSLIDALWDDDPPATALKTLQLYVSQLRRVLPFETVLTQAPGYVLRLGSGSLDAERFEELVGAARGALDAGDPDAAASRLREALGLWRGPALADFRYASFAQSEIQRLEELRLGASEELFEAELARGRHAEIVNEVEALARGHPLRERLRAQAMLALYRCGRQSEALDLYREGRRLLREELGIEPGAELKELERAILRQDDAIAAPVRVRPASPVSASRTRLRTGVTVGGLAVLVAAVVAAVLTLGAGGRRHGALADGVVRIDVKSGRVTRQVALGTGPGQTAVGAGAVWTSNPVDDTVSRVDSRAGIPEKIPVGPGPTGLAVGAGSVWVADGEGDTLERIDPSSGARIKTITVGNAPSGVAIGDGSVWDANSADGTVTRVADRSGHAMPPIPVGPGPAAVAANRTAVWVTLSRTGAVVRIDPRNDQVVDEVAVGDDPSALALGRRALWVANTDDGTVSRIDATTDQVKQTMYVGSRPVALTEAAGSLWVALGSGSLDRLDPKTLRVEKRMKLGSVPTGLATLGNSVWMTALPPAAIHRGGTLRVEVPTLDTCLCMDPAVAAPLTSWNFLDLVYDGLLAFRRTGSPAGNELVGDLAQRVPRPTDGGLTYVFRLRPGVRFSTGAPVRPSDVRRSFERVLRLGELDAPGSLPPWSKFIVGADRCGAARCDLSAGIQADDAVGTVTFRLRSPEPDFLDQLALPYAYVLPGATPDRVSARPPGATGEYEVASIRAQRVGRYQAGGTMLLVRNRAFRDYSTAAHPGGFPDRIAVHVVPAPSRAAADVKRGRADVALGYEMPEPTLESLALNHAGQLHADSLGATEYMFLNTRVPPFDDRLARRALNYAVDRGRLVELLREQSSLQPTCQLLAPGLPGYRPYCPYTLDPTPAGQWSAPNLVRAKALVAASGTRGMKVQVWTKSDHVVPGKYFASLLRSLGYRATVRIVPESEDYYGMIGSDKAQIGWAAWERDYSSAADFFLPTVSCSALQTQNYWAGNNFSNFCAPAVDRLITRGLDLQTVDPSRADAAWARADRAVAAAAPIVPYANEISETLVSRRVGNYHYSPQWGPLLEQLWVH
jgi:YVTN family beta-propeller protein